MASALIGIMVGLLVGTGTLALPTVRIVHMADSASAALYSLAESQVNRVAFLQQNPNYRAALLGILAVLAPGIVAGLVALAARSLGVLRSVMALLLAIVAVFALVSLPLAQAVPLVAIAALVFFAAVFPAVFLLSVAMWAVVGFLAADHAMALWARSDETVNATILSFIGLTRIDSPDLWRVLLSVAALVPFYGAFSSAAKSKG